MDKEQIRKLIWGLLKEEGVARFPLPVEGRIPNFEGAREAAGHLENLDVWQDSRSLKANPDSPQRWARLLALSQGKVVYMAVPRLTRVECFLELDPERIRYPDRAATIKGAFALGRPLRPERIDRLDAVLAGSVAVDTKGGRVGKGGGYSDLEYALGREYGFLRDETPVITTVHPLQLVKEDIPMLSHDISVDYAATPMGIRKLNPIHPRPQGILRELISDERRDTIPILKELWQHREW